MWRAFFFAVGTMLIILGLECLVAEQFVVSQARVPKIVTKLIDVVSSKSPPNGFDSNSSGMGFGQPQYYTGPNSGLPFGGQSAPGQSVSQYGPSRFNDSFSDPFQTGYGGVAQGNQATPFSLAGFGATNQNGIAPMATTPQFGAGNNNPGATLRSPAPIKIVTPKDWMPWSLLAAGSLVVLYTNTTARRNFSNE